MELEKVKKSELETGEEVGVGEELGVVFTVAEPRDFQTSFLPNLTH
jgi:hypothetical protein